MNNQKILKNYYFIVVLIIITVLAMVVLFYSKKTNVWRKTITNQETTNQILYVQKFQDNKLSPYLPKNILENLKEINILENKLIVYENKEKTTIETKSVLKFISNNSKQHNKTFYSNYLNQNSWEITESQSSPEYFILIGRKPQQKEVIQIIITDLLVSNDYVDLKTSSTKSQVEIILQKIHN